MFAARWRRAYLGEMSTSPNDNVSEPDDELGATVRVAAEWHEYEEALRRQDRAVVLNEQYFAELLRECLASLTERVEPKLELRARLMPPEREDLPFARSQMGAPSAFSDAIAATSIGRE